MVQIIKDKKGACYILSHKRCGFTECIFLTKEELLEVSDLIKKNIE